MTRLALLLLLLASACAIVNGSAYRVKRLPSCPSNGVVADSLLEQNACIPRDSAEAKT